MAAPSATAIDTAPRAVPPKKCGPKDRPETALQGQVPWADRLSGRAAEGYSCNLEIVGEFEGTSFANLDSYRNCMYYTDNPGGSGMAEGGGVVLDVSDPANPVKTDYLTARAMGNGGESLRVNQKRGLLVTNHYNTLQTSADTDLVRTLAVYDLKRDCRHPRLLADVIMPEAEGHEGCFQPDGMVYYMASLKTITPIDLTDPRRPKQLSDPWPLGIHGCSISDDGKRGYFAELGNNTFAPERGRLTEPGAMLVVDTSEVQKRRRGAGFKLLKRFLTPDGNIQQSTLPVRYGGRPYVINWSEAIGFATGPCPISSTTNFAYGRMIDMSDERRPREVSKVQTEVMLPKNCAAVAADRGPQTQGLIKGDIFWSAIPLIFSYDMHYCRPDRLHNPTILGCASFESGLRVFDIRDPRRPKEIAYYNTGTLSRTTPVIDLALAPPVIRRDLGMIFWATVSGGFHAAKFGQGVWPFAGDDRCPSGSDYFAAQYDLGHALCRAAKSKAKTTGATEIGRAAPASSTPSGKAGSSSDSASAHAARPDAASATDPRTRAQSDRLAATGLNSPLGGLLGVAFIGIIIGIGLLRRARRNAQ